MNGKVHATAGIVFGMGAIFFLHSFPNQNIFPVEYDTFCSHKIFENLLVGDVVYGGAVLASSWFGSLLPDIDHPTSSASKKFSILSIPYRSLQFIVGKFKATKHFVGHRGITHSLIFLAIPIILMCLSFENQWLKICLLGTSVGILSHLIMDMLTPMGVPLFLPLSRRKYRLLPKKFCIKTR